MAIFEPGSLLANSGQISWKSPSNIALIKYWGKKRGQIAVNPSLSMTLSAAFTETSLEFQTSSGSGPTIEFYFEGKREEAFGARIIKFIHSLTEDFPDLIDLSIKLNSTNSFPHSSGIASSASAMSALALCLVSLFLDEGHPDFYRIASHIARLGSGSAARSVYGGYTVWGDTILVDNSSDEYAIDINSMVHPVFQDWKDSILIVSREKKAVSSSKGHELMNGHFYSEGRIDQAHQHLADLLRIMSEGNVNEFVRIIENEALSLHGLMLSSDPSFLLMAPGTVQIIQKIRQFREHSAIPVCFSLDAGPNVHILYPETHQGQVKKFISGELAAYCDQEYWIDDRIGNGPERLK
jgi:diphosphomevalonate decarboxylase